jgi:hypothetical protein
MYPGTAGPPSAIRISGEDAPRHRPVEPIMLAQRQLRRRVITALGGRKQPLVGTLEGGQRGRRWGIGDVSECGYGAGGWQNSQSDRGHVSIHTARAAKHHQQEAEKNRGLYPARWMLTPTRRPRIHYGTGSSRVTSVVRPGITRAGAANSWPPTTARTQYGPGAMSPNTAFSPNTSSPLTWLSV